MKQASLSGTEKNILSSLAKVGSMSLLSLRGNLNLPIDIFVNSVQFLVQNGLAEQRSMKLTITTNGLSTLQSNRFGNRPERFENAVPYLQTISSTQLAVGEFFIPNKENFLRSYGKSR